MADPVVSTDVKSLEEGRPASFVSRNKKAILVVVATLVVVAVAAGTAAGVVASKVSPSPPSCCCSTVCAMGAASGASRLYIPRRRQGPRGRAVPVLQNRAS